MSKKLIVILFLIISCDSENLNNFENKEVEIKINIIGNGSVEYDKSLLYYIGDDITLIANPEDGNYFSYWGGEIYSNLNAITFNLSSSSLEIDANFNTISPEIVLFDQTKTDKDNLFIIENGGNIAYQIDKGGSVLNSWEFDLKLGNDLELLEDGSVIGIFKPSETFFSFGGYGGIIRKYDPQKNLIWEYELNNENYLLHHDFQILPNGNLIILAWERITAEEARNNGIPRSTDIYAEYLIEVNMSTNEIVWDWRSWDHRIQNVDPNAPYYGDIFEHKNKIDFNYNDFEDGDIMHANGIAYNFNTNHIYISVNFYDEIWVIDHGISSEETSSEKGDLLYRFGNLSPYKGGDTKIFDRNHHPNFISNHLGSIGNLMVFVNGNSKLKSSIMELKIPGKFIDESNNFIPPEIVWHYENEELFFGKISGAVRLPNGNTLVCEGDYGYWEVTNEKDVVWKYHSEGKTFWRGYNVPFLN
jgi:hypothetical protein